MFRRLAVPTSLLAMLFAWLAVLGAGPMATAQVWESVGASWPAQVADGALVRVASAEPAHHTAVGSEPSDDEGNDPEHRDDAEDSDDSPSEWFAVIRSRPSLSYPQSPQFDTTSLAALPPWVCAPSRERRALGARAPPAA